MFGRYHPRWLAERADATFSPITLTVISTLAPSSTSETQLDTTSSTTTTSQTSTSSTASFATQTATSAQTSVQTSVLPTSQSDTPTEIPVASAITSSPSSAPNIMADSSVTGTQRVPAGAIVGIVLAGVIVVLAGLVFFLRNRFKRRRQQRRTWLQRNGVPSQAVTGITASSFAPAEIYPETPMRGNLSPGMSFARAQQQALASRSPAATSTSIISPPPPYPTATVQFSFVPDLSDELEIVNGETLTMIQEFDDGWALCANRGGTQGMVPLECLDRKTTAVQYGMAMGSAVDARNSNRASSLQSQDRV